jgi:hypothetical protein
MNIKLESQCRHTAVWTKPLDVRDFMTLATILTGSRNVMQVSHDAGVLRVPSKPFGLEEGAYVPM